MKFAFLSLPPPSKGVFFTFQVRLGRDPTAFATRIRRFATRLHVLLDLLACRRCDMVRDGRFGGSESGLWMQSLTWTCRPTTSWKPSDSVASRN